MFVRIRPFTHHKTTAKIGAKIRTLKKEKDQFVASKFKDINKLIFVQELETAYTEINVLCENHPENYEIQFRRVELANKIGTLLQLLDQLQTPLKSGRKATLAQEFAAALIEIRLTEQDPFKNLEKQMIISNDGIINPSKHKAIDSFIGLNHNSELTTQKITENFLATEQPIWDEILKATQLLENKNNTEVIDNKLRIHRSAQVPDDFFGSELPHLTEVYIDEISDAMVKVEKKESLDIFQGVKAPPFLKKVIQLKQEHSNNYASYFIAGCAYEAFGQLSLAIECWQIAFQIQHKSLAVLSTLSELQQIGALANEQQNYSALLEEIDANLVHGSYETHIKIHKEFLKQHKYKEAISALRILADWHQQQNGHVPPEIEMLCLLGARKAYLMAGKTEAASACAFEAEELLIKQSQNNISSTQLLFMAQLCEEYNMKQLWNIAVSNILKSKKTQLKILLQCASNLVAQSSSLETISSLKTAYQNTNGNGEIRFYILAAKLKIKNISIEKYLDRKIQVREYMSNNNIGAAITLIQECLYETTEDSEIHYYMGEIQQRFKNNILAEEYFALMYEFDHLNITCLLHYLKFLIKIEKFKAADEVLKSNMPNSQKLNQNQNSELLWIKAHICLSENKVTEADEHITRALAINPWNQQLLISALDIKNSFTQFSENDFNKIQEYKNHFSSNLTISDSIQEFWLNIAEEKLHKGQVEIAYCMSKCSLLTAAHSMRVIELFCQSAAAKHSRQSVQEILLLSQSHTAFSIPFSHLAICAAQIYAYAAEWSLVEEWIDISQRTLTDNIAMKAKVLELESLKLALSGSQLSKAQSLAEASLDTMSQLKEEPQRLLVLLGYLMVVQGEIKRGLEKIYTAIEKEPSIQNLYFCIKAMQRGEQNTNQQKELIAKIYTLSPINSLEQKFLEEVFVLVNHKNPAIQASLIC